MGGYSTEESVEKAEVIIRDFDVNKDGLISKEEFIAAYKSNQLSIDEKYMHHIFQRLDTKQTGFIELDELQVLVPDQKQALSLLHEVDKAGDDRISFNEFKSALSNAMGP